SRQALHADNCTGSVCLQCADWPATNEWSNLPLLLLRRLPRNSHYIPCEDHKFLSGSRRGLLRRQSRPRTVCTGLEIGRTQSDNNKELVQHENLRSPAIRRVHAGFQKPRLCLAHNPPNNDPQIQSLSKKGVRLELPLQSG